MDMWGLCIGKTLTNATHCFNYRQNNELLNNSSSTEFKIYRMGKNTISKQLAWFRVFLVVVVTTLGDKNTFVFE